MWQNILVITIVALTAALVGWNFYRKLTGKASCCGGCAASGSTCCGNGRSGNTGGPPTATPLQPLKGTGCGCGR